jgi:HflK protein
MIDFLLDVVWETWAILKDASVFLLVGFLVAGVLAVLMPAGLLTRLVGTGKIKSVLWASVLGAPLPLCTCGVLPTALGLRKQGATAGATVAFLVATPETGVDSISLTYALTDPVMTVFRPIAGVLTAIIAGLATNVFGVRAASQAGVEDVRKTAPVEAGCCQDDDTHGAHVDHHHEHLAPAPLLAPSVMPDFAAVDVVRRVVRYGFVELLDDISWWLVLGIILSAVADAAVPAGLLESNWGGGIGSMLLMLMLSVVLYTCASSSTPMAAALALKGLSPGAVLVFLLAGPATNIGSLVVLLKTLGRRAMAVYLAAVALAALAAGLVLNAIYQAFGLDPRATFGAAAGFLPDYLKAAGALLFIGLLITSLYRTRVPEEWQFLRQRIAALTGIYVTPRGLAFGAAALAILIYVGSGIFTVSPNEVGIRLRFGRIVAAELEPGLHARWPWPFESHRLVATTRVERLEFGLPPKLSREEATRALTRNRLAFGSNPAPEQVAPGVIFQKGAAPEDAFLLTGDSNLIDLRAAAQYRVKNALGYAYNVAQPEPLVRSTLLAALRGVVARHAIDAVYTTAREDIERETRQSAQTMLDAYRAGVEVLSVRLLYDHPPEPVHDAFRDVASAQEDKLRTINLANVFAVEKVNQAKGEAAAMTQGALAFKEARIKAAQADADAFALRLDAYQRAPELTRFRLQMESLEDLLPGVRKFVRPGTGDVKELDMWLFQPPGMGPSK